MTELTVVCAGRLVDDYGQPYGEPCGARWRPPVMVLPPGRYVAHPLDTAWHRPTVGEVVERARAGGWALPDGQEPADGELLGTCPQCRRPAAEVADLVKERKKANGRKNA